MEKNKEKELLGKFENQCQTIHKELDDRRHKGFLYHYMNYEALVCILETRKMRYTDYRFFNDPTEVRYGQNTIVNCISESDLPHKNLLTQAINRVFDVLNNDCNMFVSCYSTRVNKLALWRYYGNDGCGFAIAFNDNYQKTDADISEPILGKITISQVMYGADSKTLVNKFIEEYLVILNEAKTKGSNGEFLRELDKKIISHLLSVIPILKDDSFRDEDEVRLYCQEGKLLIDPKTNQPFEFPDEMRDFVPIESKNIPFVLSLTGNKPVLYPDEFDPTSISEIWVGPCCEFFEARKEIRKLLSQFGYGNVQIKQARLPYRQ